MMVFKNGVVFVVLSLCVSITVAAPATTTTDVIQQPDVITLPPSVTLTTNDAQEQTSSTTTSVTTLMDISTQPTFITVRDDGLGEESSSSSSSLTSSTSAVNITQDMDSVTQSSSVTLTTTAGDQEQPSTSSSSTPSSQNITQTLPSSSSTPSLLASSSIFDMINTTSEIASTTSESTASKIPSTTFEIPSTTSAFASVTSEIQSTASGIPSTTSELASRTTRIITAKTTVSGSGFTGVGVEEGIECEGRLAAVQCVNGAYKAMTSSLFFFMFSQNIDHFLGDVCRKYPVHRQCVKNALTQCPPSQSMAFDVGMAAFDFVCFQQGKRAVKEAWPCLMDQSVGEQLRICSQRISQFAASYGPCGVATQYVHCVSATFQQRCSAVSADAIRELLTVTLSPFSSFFRCQPISTTVPPTTFSNLNTTEYVPATTKTTADDTTTTTTTTTTASTEASTRPALIKCYDCSSGSPGRWQNTQCPTNGDLDIEHVTLTNCTAPCFARVTLFPAGNVVRGCSAGWNWSFPEGFPTGGCQRASNGEVWCFCDHHRCNNFDMTSLVQGYIP